MGTKRFVAKVPLGPRLESRGGDQGGNSSACDLRAGGAGETGSGPTVTRCAVVTTEEIVVRCAFCRHKERTWSVFL